MKPSIGRIVHYILSAQDKEQIERRRSIGVNPPASLERGVQAHVGNPPSVNEHIPMIICAVWPNEYGPNLDGVNGQALLDGNDSLWVTSAKEGMEPSTWHWPERID